MEENNNEFNENNSNDKFGLDSGGSETINQELESSEFEEGINGVESGIDDGLGDDSSLSIDYTKLTASVRDAQIINTLDSDLDSLPVSDVILLIIALFLGIIIVGGKRK